MRLSHWSTTISYLATYGHQMIFFRIYFKVDDSINSIWNEKNSHHRYINWRAAVLNPENWCPLYGSGFCLFAHLFDYQKLRALFWNHGYDYYSQSFIFIPWIYIKSPQWEMATQNKPTVLMASIRWQKQESEREKMWWRKRAAHKSTLIRLCTQCAALHNPKWLKRWKEEVQFGSTVYVAKNVRAIVCMCVYSIHYKTLLHCTCVLLNIEDAIRPKKSNNSIHDTAIYRLVWIDNEREKKERNKPYTFVKTYKLPMRYDFLLFLAM